MMEENRQQYVSSGESRDPRQCLARPQSRCRKAFETYTLKLVSLESFLLNTIEMMVRNKCTRGGLGVLICLSYWPIFLHRNLPAYQPQLQMTVAITCFSYPVVNIIKNQATNDELNIR